MVLRRFILKVVYCDRITLFSLIALIVRRNQYNALFVFDGPSCNKLFVRIAAAIKLIPAEPQFLNMPLYELGTYMGEGQAVYISDKARDFAHDFIQNNLSKSLLVEKLSKELPKEEISLFLMKRFANIIFSEILLIHAAIIQIKK